MTKDPLEQFVEDLCDHLEERTKWYCFIAPILCLGFAILFGVLLYHELTGPSRFWLGCLYFAFLSGSLSQLVKELRLNRLKRLQIQLQEEVEIQEEVNEIYRRYGLDDLNDKS